MTGTPLGSAQLNAAANVAGTFGYTPPSGTVLPPGSHTLSTTFTPGDANNYVSTTTTVDIVVLEKPTPTLAWPIPADIVYGTPLGPNQLNATTDVPGTFVYDPPAGTVLPVGLVQTLSVTFTPTDTATYSTATRSVPITVWPEPFVDPPPVKIGTGAGGTWVDATGHSAQSHPDFAPNAGVWWLFTLTSAHDSLNDRNVHAYVSSGPNLATATWTEKTASPNLANAGGATSSVLAGGRSLGVAPISIGGVDYVHVFASAAFDGQASSNGHIRAQLGAGSITWGAWDNPGSPNTASQWQGPPGTGGTGQASHTPWGNSVGISTGGFIHHFSTTMDQEVDCAVGRSTNADTTATWTNGFGKNVSPTGVAGTSPPNTTAVIDKTMVNECKVLTFAPLASDVMLAVYGNGFFPQPEISNLRYKRSGTGGSAGKWTNISASTGGGDGDVFAGVDARIDQNDWALVAVSTNTIYTFRAKADRSGLDGVIYNTGSNNWSALTGSSVPPSFGTGQSFKSSGGLFGATDGSNVWLFAINGSDTTANSILFTKFNGSSWTSWAVVPGTTAGTHTRNFITGYRTLSSSQIGLAWTEGPAAN